MAIVKSPNPNYTGVSASIPFCNGEGHTDSAHLIRWFENHGYTVIEEKKNTDITKMNREELMKMAASLGIETESTMTKDTIIKLIRNYKKELEGSEE